MSNSLEERLQEHSNAFDGLLSLIPAKYYYDGDTSNQWQQKRKTKEEHQANKRQKLDPANNKNVSAKDVLKETEKSAKPVVLPGEKFKKYQEELKKKQQEEESNEEEEEDEDEEASSDEDAKEEDSRDEKLPSVNREDELIQENVTIVFDDNGEEVSNEEYRKAELQKQQNQKQHKAKKQLSKEEQEERDRKHRELKAKLQAKIQSMREKRKAPGSKAPGAATSRQQILEERRKKAEMKKEKKGKVEADDESSDEDMDEDEGDGGVAAAGGAGQTGSSVMFGNIEFLDGERVSSDLTSSRKVGKGKGPANKDIKGHLKKLEREKVRAEEMDTDSRRKLEDKNKWKKALASVQGIKVKDDEKLLKKALRRKESKQRKSEREWKDRIQTVADEKKMKSDRREENLRIRKENKGKDRKHQVKQLPSYKRSRSHKKLPGAKRAGFEGGIKSHKKK